MVSIRRRKLLGLCSGRSSFQLPRFFDSGNTPENCSQNLSVHPLPSISIDLPKEETVLKLEAGSSRVSTSSSSKEQTHQQFLVPEVKRRKKHRRKQVENREQCLMRGVYFKNMKWQAAIKVEKKQIHLGTVGSQEEAAHLYDRAAFMCGREPNFELSEEEKQELMKFKWDEFLAVTRSTITSKKQQKRSGTSLHGKAEGSAQYNGFSASEGEADASLS